MCLTCRQIGAAVVLVGCVLAWGSPLAAPTARADDKGNPPPVGLKARLGTARLRHGNGVGCVAFSPNGLLLASGGGDGKLFLNEVATGKLEREFSGTPLKSVHFSADGKLLFAGDTLGKIVALDAANGKEVREFPSHERLAALTLSPDGRYLVSTGYNSIVRVCESATGKVVHQFVAHKTGVISVAYSRDGKHIATGGEDGTARLWEASTAKEVHQLAVSPPGPTRRVEALMFTQDGKTLITGGSQLPLTYWDVATGKETRRFALRGVMKMALAPDGKSMAIGHHGATVSIWDFAEAKQVRQWERHTDQVQAVAFSPDGKIVASASSDHTVRLWDIPGDRELFPHEGHHRRIQGLVFFPDGKHLASHSFDRSVRIWDIASAKEVHRLKESVGGTAPLSVAADGETLLVMGPSKLLHTWKPGQPAKIRQLKSHPFFQEQEYFVSGFSPDGQTLAVAGPGVKVVVIDVGADRELHSLKGLQGTGTALAFSSDSRCLAVADLNGTVLVSDGTTGNRIVLIHGKPIDTRPGPALAFSRDGRSIATADFEIRVWETATGEERVRFPALTPRQPIGSVAFSVDGRLLLVGTWEGMIAVLDLASGKLIRQFQAHRGTVGTMVFSPDGSIVATGGNDANILLLDVEELGKGRAPLRAKLLAAEVDALWLNLADADAGLAYRAVLSLAAVPDLTLPLLKDRLKPATEADTRRIVALLAQLDDDAAAVRQNAHRELAAYSKFAESALKKAQEGTPSAEVKKRLEELLDTLKKRTVPADRVRGLRALEVLEQINTPEARKIVESQTTRSDDDAIRQAARATLERMSRRGPARP